MGKRGAQLHKNRDSMYLHPYTKQIRQQSVLAREKRNLVELAHEALEAAWEATRAAGSALKAAMDALRAVLLALGLISCSSALFVAQVRNAVWFMCGSRRGSDARAWGRKRLEPFPHEALYAPEIVALGPVEVVAQKERTVRTIACSILPRISALLNFDARGVRAAGGARQTKLGSINAVVSLKLTHTQWHKACALGHPREYIDVEAVLARVNTSGAVFAPNVQPADRELVARYLRTQPLVFEQRGKDFSEEMMEACAEMIAMAREEGRDEAEAAAATTAAVAAAPPPAGPPAALRL